MENKVHRAIIYARCSTKESKQDVEVQLRELRGYCERSNWYYDEVSEYGSGYKEDKQPKLAEIINKIRMKHYDVMIVFSIDRFSRQSPGAIHALLDIIADQYNCRFLALQQGIDSDNKMIWHGMKGLWIYFANKWSEDLSDKIKKGIARKKEKGKYNGGRPRKDVDVGNIVAQKANGASLRAIAAQLSEGKPKKQRVSFQTIRRRMLQKHTEDSTRENSSITAVT
jgi:DNA invertase Pin-like site-specific DNA recombinase